MSDRGGPPAQFPAKVCAERCATCIFGPRSPISRERFAELSAKWAKMRGGHQTCHTYGTSEGGEDVWCRGFYDTQVTAEWRTVFEAMGYIIEVPATPECDPLDR